MKTEKGSGVSNGVALLLCCFAGVFFFILAVSLSTKHSDISTTQVDIALDNDAGMLTAGKDTTDTKVYPAAPTDEEKAVSALQECVSNRKEDFVAEKRLQGYECGWLSNCSVNAGIRARGWCAYNLSRDFANIDLYHILGKHPEMD